MMTTIIITGILSPVVLWKATFQERKAMTYVGSQCKPVYAHRSLAIWLGPNDILRSAGRRRCHCSQSLGVAVRHWLCLLASTTVERTAAAPARFQRPRTTSVRFKRRYSWVYGHRHFHTVTAIKNIFSGVLEFVTHWTRCDTDSCLSVRPSVRPSVTSLQTCYFQERGESYAVNHGAVGRALLGSLVHSVSSNHSAICNSLPVCPSGTGSPV